MENSNVKLKMPKSDSDEIWVIKFDEESAQEFREQVIRASRNDPTQPIVVYIDSYGGLVDSLAKMIETMDEMPNPFITVCMGKAMSCGAVLLSHGDIRWCGKHSRVMVHEVSSGTQGDVNDMKADAQEADRLNKWFMGLLAKNCGIKGGYEGLRKIIKQRDGRDMYLDAKAALEFGIADAIGTPKITPITVYDVQTSQEKLKGLRDRFKKAAKSSK